MTDVTILHEAEVELWEAVAYYEERAPGLGLDFETEIERSVQAIAEHPERWPLREDGTRRYLTHRFPYLVVYASCIGVIVNISKGSSVRLKIE